MSKNKLEMRKRLAIKNKGKKAVALDFLFWLILGVIVLVIIVFIIMILTGKGNAALEYIKDLFRWSFVGILINKHKINCFFKT